MVIGWISFKGSNYGVTGPSDIFNLPPTANNLFVYPADSAYCGITGYPPVRVRWQFSDPGDTQKDYQIQVFRVSDGQKVVDTGKKSGYSG